MTENDRHAFYNFWMSSLGRLLTSLWKVDLNVVHRYIPYVWFKDINEFAKWFDLTSEEQKVIEDTMAKLKPCPRTFSLSTATSTRTSQRLKGYENI